MKRFNFAAVAALAALGIVGCSSDNVGPESPALGKAASPAPSDAIPGQYAVRFKAGVPADFEATVKAGGGSVVYANSAANFAFITGVSSDAAGKIGTMASVAEIQADAPYTVSPAAMTSVEADATGGEPGIESQANPATAARYPWQWNMRLINADKAWAAGKLGSSNVTVAILDTGLDYDINDLNGLVDLSRSTSMVPSDNALAATYFPTRNPVTDFHGHGTNVATQVSSKAFALAGVTSRTTLMGVKVLGRTGSGSTAGVLSGVIWAAEHGANIANMSLGSAGGYDKSGNGRFTSLINNTFNYARSKGMLTVVSAGNEAADLDHNGNIFQPYCDTPGVVCVSSVGMPLATADGDTPAYYTNYGRSAITVAGPGGNADAAHGFTTSAWPWGTDIASWVWSYCPKDRIAGLTTAGVPVLTVCAAGNRLTGYIGTSQASPHVAGLAALILSERGPLSPDGLKDAIIASGVDRGQPGTDPLFGKGRIDVAKALGL